MKFFQSGANKRTIKLFLLHFFLRIFVNFDSVEIKLG